MRPFVVHAHFYQPPREDPWFELTDAEVSALPDHDWNARIDRECYSPFGAAEMRAVDSRAQARDPDARGGISKIVNLYAWCSFDAGPTLCEWMDKSSDTFAKMLAGDQASVARLGHGNAIAAPFHHIILPLASRRDKITEVRWGIADFKRRFNRNPEGMWLPECAVDEETLEILAIEGIQFTILAPYQFRTEQSHNGTPVRWRAGGGKEIAILPYDGSLAGEVAFGGMLNNSELLAQRIIASSSHSERGCTTLATDGETFGHHHPRGIRTLADAFSKVHAAGIRIENAASVVAAAKRSQAMLDAHLVAPSSWSCAHGVERWRSDCGCRLDSSASTSQRWRGPLRESLEKLAAQCHNEFEQHGSNVFADNPWEVRDAYGEVVSFEDGSIEQFIKARLRDDSSSEQLQHAKALLEMERAVLRTFTSCAWFFDDVARIEVRQVLRYAARALSLSGKAARLTNELIAGLEHAVGNNSVSQKHNPPPTGADIFVREALPHQDPLLKAASAAAIMAHEKSLQNGTVNNASICVGAYTALVATVSTSPLEYRVTVNHSRSGESSTVDLQINEDGVNTNVTIHGGAVASQRFFLHELPDIASRSVLLKHTNSETLFN